MYAKMSTVYKTCYRDTSDAVCIGPWASMWARNVNWQKLVVFCLGSEMHILLMIRNRWLHTNETATVNDTQTCDFLSALNHWWGDVGDSKCAESSWPNHLSSLPVQTIHPNKDANGDEVSTAYWSSGNYRNYLVGRLSIHCYSFEYRVSKDDA